MTRQQQQKEQEAKKGGNDSLSWCRRTPGSAWRRHTWCPVWSADAASPCLWHVHSTPHHDTHTSLPIMPLSLSCHTRHSPSCHSPCHVTHSTPHHVTHSSPCHVTPNTPVTPNISHNCTAQQLSLPPHTHTHTHTHTLLLLTWNNQYFTEAHWKSDTKSA